MSKPIRMTVLALFAAIVVVAATSWVDSATVRAEEDPVPTEGDTSSVFPVEPAMVQNLDALRHRLEGAAALVGTVEAAATPPAMVPVGMASLAAALDDHSVGPRPCPVALPVAAEGGRGVVNVSIGIGTRERISRTWYIGLLMGVPQSMWFFGVPLRSGTFPAIDPPHVVRFPLAIGPVPAVGVMNVFFRADGTVCASSMSWTSTAPSTVRDGI